MARSRGRLPDKRVQGTDTSSATTRKEQNPANNHATELQTESFSAEPSNDCCFGRDPDPEDPAKLPLDS